MELLARTYVAIDNYNVDISGELAQMSRYDWALWNLRVATAITMSLNPLLISYDREPMDFMQDFGNTKYIGEFPQELK